MLKLFMLLFPISLYASEPITISEIIELSKNAPASLEAQSEVEAATYEATAFKRNTYLPKVVGIGSYTKLDREVGLNNPLASAPLPPGLEALQQNPISSFDGTLLARLQIEQPLIDFSGIHYGRKAANKKIEAAKLKGNQDVKEVQIKALNIYLKLLEIRSKKEALENYVSNLKSRNTEIRRLYELGAVSEADLLKVKLGVDDATQGIREIEENEKFLGQILGQTLGKDIVYSPENLRDNLPMITIIQDSEKVREDIQALTGQIEATELEAKAAGANILPRLSLTGGVTYYDQEFLTDKSFADIGLRLTWPIFDGAIGSAKKQQALAKKNALEHKKRSALMGISAEKEGALRSLNLRSREYQERTSGANEAKRAARLDFNRFKQGKINVNNLLDAEDLLKDRVEKASLSKINWYKEWFRYQYASGQEFSFPQ